MPEGRGRARKAGSSPAAAKREGKSLAEREAADTFEVVAREWHASRKPAWAERHAADVMADLERFASPAIGAVPIRRPKRAAELIESTKSVASTAISGSAGNTTASNESLTWRFLGQPPWLINSDVTSAYLSMGCIGAAAHIVRPGLARLTGGHASEAGVEPEAIVANGGTLAGLARAMTRGSWMAYGIWVGWGAVVWRTAESLTWRFLGQPPWLINSDVTSAYLFMGCIGAAAHIVRPGELGERIPAPEQIRIGVIVGALAAVGLALVYAPEILALLRGAPVHGDLPRGAVG